jgi:hypothetical protein
MNAGAIIGRNLAHCRVFVQKPLIAGRHLHRALEPPSNQVAAKAMLALGAVVIAPIVLSQLGLSGASETLIGLARWPIVLGLVVLGLTMLYRYGPSLSDPQWTWLFPGNVIAAMSWLILSAVFSWYIGHFGNYDATYGSLGAANVAMAGGFLTLAICGPGLGRWTPGAVEPAKNVSSQTLMGHSYRVIRRMRYGTGSSWERHNDRGGPSSDTT